MGDKELKIAADAMKKIEGQDSWASPLTKPMMPPHRQKDFEDLEASQLLPDLPTRHGSAKASLSGAAR